VSVVTGELTRIFEPIRIGNKTARNRIASTPHTTGFGENGYPTERYARYHAEKAKGGAGLVMTFGSCSVHPSTPSNGEIAAWDDGVVPHLTRMAEMVHEHGALLISQIAHRGRRTLSDATERPLLAPSDLLDPDPVHREIPHEIEVEQIDELIAAFAAAAVRFREGGFDGVEVNSIGGQLIEQFWSPQMNVRRDEWGGSLENRMRFGVRVVQAVRAAVGQDFIVGFRMTADEGLVGGLTPEELREIARGMDGLGLLNYISLTGGFGTTLTTTAVATPSMDFPHMTFLRQGRALRDVINAPVLYAGRVMTPAEAEAIVRRGDADIVAMTRAMIADPHLVNKARQGRLDDIRLCVGANEGCIGRRYLGLPIFCVHNPAIGREAELMEIESAAEPKRVVVVGGGPAGLEAARVAAIRGHEVTLYEREPAVGGQILTLIRAPHRREYRGVVDWLEGQVRKLPVDLRLGHSVTANEILALKPDAVVVAAGARPRRPDIPGADAAHVVPVDDVLNGRHRPGKKVVLLDEDGHLRGVSTADFLSAQGVEVIVVTRLWSVGEDIDPTLKPIYYERLLRQGVVMMPHSEAIAIGDDWVRVRNVYSGVEQTIDGVDTVVTAYGGKANDGVYRDLKGMIPGLHLVGDAAAPRRLAIAMLEATRAARAM
jgi:mycofactocin system FadH/OYE family oxidoreductase 2